MACHNTGVCSKCERRVPAEHVIRDGKVFLRKHCPDCGDNDGLVSNDAAVWQKKRDIYHYDPETQYECTLHCDDCSIDHHPRLIFLDVTNRCNLNCPICIANIPGMGFEFHPPLEYFEKIFAELSTWEPRPRVQLFGGEPTLRKDLFEIIDMADRNGLPLTMASNVITLANEEFCKKVCTTKTHILIAFDGLNPEIYEKMRGKNVLEKKLQAFENLLKHSRIKHTVACTVARSLNDKNMKDLLDFVHRHRSIVKRFNFLPLTEMWEDGEYERDEMTTPEDAEKIVDAAMPDKVEFLPAGLTGAMEPAYRFFGKHRLRFSGVHPNCESFAYFYSDGEQYRAPSAFLKRSLFDLCDEFVTRAQRVNPRLEKLDPKKPFQRLRAQLLVLRTFGGLMWSALDLNKIFKGHPTLGVLRVLGGVLMGKKVKDQLMKVTGLHAPTLAVILPFEEPHSIESARLEGCSVEFAYLDPQTEAVRTVPFCSWCLYRKDVMRSIADKYEAEATEPVSS